MRISSPRKQAWPFAISNIADHAKFYSRSDDAVIRVYDKAGNMDRDARAQERFQGAVNGLAILQPFRGHLPLWKNVFCVKPE
jgi:hypothetical protein